MSVLGGVPDPAGWNRIQELETQLREAPHYEYTCDAGWCDRVTAAIVLTDDGWMSMCRTHAAYALGATERAWAVIRALTGDGDA